MGAHAPPRILRLEVETPQGASGTLGNERGSFLFAYRADASPAQAVSLLMPPRLQPYATSSVPPPVFSMNLPEGYVLDQIRDRLAKVVRIDPLLLLSITGDSHPIGRLALRAPGLDALLPDRGSPPAAGEDLAEILRWDGTEDLFALLVDRYILRSGISGIQPKVVVPERASTRTAELIVKRSGDEFPHLAVNEFICMSIARAAGMPVPEFWLSDNRELFVMRRFDIDAAGQRLGFEDFAALTGRQPDRKYDGSYEMIAKGIRYFVSEPHRDAALAQLFDSVALSCLIGNGDAHLKNFGVLYTHPEADDTRMAPVYDVVNTTAYLPQDSLALKLRGSKAFAGVTSLQTLAADCEVADPQARIHTILDAAAATFREHRALLDAVPRVREAIEKAIDASTGSWPRPGTKPTPK